jgi:hypothetical protein
MANWYTVVESKISWAPIGTRTMKNGEEKTRFSRIGIRINMADGSWWFYSFKHESWTLHQPGRQELDRLGRPHFVGGKPVMGPERKTRFANWRAVLKEYDARPSIVASLQSAVEAALTAEAESEA